METLDGARDRYFEAAANGGTFCPCCGKYGRVYTRRLNGTMAAGLIWLVRRYRERNCAWIEVPKLAPKWLLKTNQLPTCRYWQLVEQQPHEPDAKKHSGCWRPTDFGMQFVDRVVWTYEKVEEYRGQVRRYLGESVSILDVLGTAFNYSELMAGDVDYWERVGDDL